MFYRGIDGKFYKRHLHKWVVRAAAFYWLGCQLTWEGLRWTYQHRSEILATANQYRNRIGKAFSYQSPAMERNWPDSTMLKVDGAPSTFLAPFPHLGDALLDVFVDNQRIQLSGLSPSGDWLLRCSLDFIE